MYIILSFCDRNRQSIMLLHLLQCLFEVSTYKVALLVQGIGVTWPITLEERLGWRAKLTMDIRNFNVQGSQLRTST